MEEFEKNPLPFFGMKFFRPQGISTAYNLHFISRVRLLDKSEDGLIFWKINLKDEKDSKQ